MPDPKPEKQLLKVGSMFGQIGLPTGRSGVISDKNAQISKILRSNIYGDYQGSSRAPLVSKGSNFNIGLTNIWIMEFRRILGKITKSKAFQIRPKKKQIMIGFIRRQIRSHIYIKYPPLSGKTPLRFLDSKVRELWSRIVNVFFFHWTEGSSKKKDDWLSNLHPFHKKISARPPISSEMHQSPWIR